MDRTSTVTGRLGHRLFPNRTHEGFLAQGGATSGALTASVTRYGFDGAVASAQGSVGRGPRGPFTLSPPPPCPPPCSLGTAPLPIPLPDPCAADLADPVPQSDLEADDGFPSVFGHAAARWGHSHWYLLHGGLSTHDATSPSDASVYLYDRHIPQPAMKTMHVTINGTLAPATGPSRDGARGRPDLPHRRLGPRRHRVQRRVRHRIWCDHSYARPLGLVAGGS